MHAFVAAYTVSRADVPRLDVTERAFDCSGRSPLVLRSRLSSMFSSLVSCVVYSSSEERSTPGASFTPSIRLEQMAEAVTPSLNNVLDTLILYAFENGVLTTLAALLSLITVSLILWLAIERVR